MRIDRTFFVCPLPGVGSSINRRGKKGGPLVRSALLSVSVVERFMNALSESEKKKAENVYQKNPSILSILVYQRAPDRIRFMCLTR